MDNIGFDIVDIAAAACKDAVYADAIRQLHDEYIKLRKAENECRMEKSKALIQCRARVEIELKKLESTYCLLERKHGKIPEIEDYISAVKAHIKRLSFDKNHLKHLK